MKTQGRSILAALAATIVATLLFAWVAIGAGAPTQRKTEARVLPQAVRRNFGMVGVTAGQTARLSVVDVSGDVPPGPCTVQMVFLDDRGAPVLPPVQSPLEPGHAAFMDFTPVDSAGRREVRGSIEIECPSDPSRSPIGTIQVFDNTTGRTTLLQAAEPLMRAEN